MSFKVFVLGDISGFSCKFEFLTGATDHVCVTNEPDFGASSNIVIRPAGHIPEKGNYKIYVNNQFNSIGLNIYMCYICNDHY